MFRCESVCMSALFCSLAQPQQWTFQQIVFFSSNSPLYISFECKWAHFSGEENHLHSKSNLNQIFFFVISESLIIKNTCWPIIWSFSVASLCIYAICMCVWLFTDTNKSMTRSVSIWNWIEWTVFLLLTLVLFANLISHWISILYRSSIRLLCELHSGA